MASLPEIDISITREPGAASYHLVKLGFRNLTDDEARRVLLMIADIQIERKANADAAARTAQA